MPATGYQIIRRRNRPGILHADINYLFHDWTFSRRHGLNLHIQRKYLYSKKGLMVKLCCRANISCGKVFHCRLIQFGTECHLYCDMYRPRFALRLNCADRRSACSQCVNCNAFCSEKPHEVAVAGSDVAFTAALHGITVRIYLNSCRARRTIYCINWFDSIALPNVPGDILWHTGYFEGQDIANEQFSA